MSAEPLILAEATGIAGVAVLRDAVFERIKEAPGSAIEIDCSAVRSIDAASLQCLLVARGKALAAGGGLVLRNPSEDFIRYTSYVGLTAELLS